MSEPPKEVFYVMGHGMIQSSEVLNIRQRFGIPIVYMGTEGTATYPCPSMLLIPYYMKIHGNIFMNKLFSILQQYGEQYDKKFKPNQSKLEKDIRFLFDINKKDRKTYPQNMLRAYTGTDTVLNTRIACSKPQETFFYNGILSHKTKDFLTTKVSMQSSPNSQYSLNSFTYKNKDQFFNLINPFGIFQFNEKQKTFDLKHRFTTTITTLQDILKFIRSQTSQVPIVFMIHCKEPDTEILMDFDFKENPLEKFHKKSLSEMMKLLTIKEKTPTPSPTGARKRKRSTPPKTPTPTRKRKRATPPKTPTPMAVVSPTPTPTRKRKRATPTPTPMAVVSPTPTRK